MPKNLSIKIFIAIVLGSAFGLQNLFYTISSPGGVEYQVPFLQIAPTLGISSLYGQLFPSIFNGTSTTGNTDTATTNSTGYYYY